MVGADELALKMLACYSVYDVTIDLTVPVDDAILAREVFVFSMNMKSMRLKFRGTEFTTQIFVISIHPELVGVGRLVLNAVVDLVVGNAGACAEGNLTAEVREEV